jgi:voltage-gated potassium channel
MRRRAGRRMVARALLTSAAALVMLYTGCRCRSSGCLRGCSPGGRLLVFAGTSAWQIRASSRSQYPALRAVQALAGATPLFLTLFASAYLRIAAAQADAFTEPLSTTSPPPHHHRLRNRRVGDITLKSRERGSFMRG